MKLNPIILKISGISYVVSYRSLLQICKNMATESLTENWDKAFKITVE